MPKRNHHAARQRGNINDRRGFQVFLRVGERVGKHQAPFGVRVGDFNGDAVVHGDDVVRTHAVARDHVLRHCKQGVHFDRQLQFSNGLHGAKHRAAAQLVVLHALHAVVHLQAVAAGVIGEGLANQYQPLALRRARTLARDVRNVNQAALGDAAVAHRGQAAHAHLLGLRMINDLALETSVARQFLGLRGNPGGVTDIGRRGADGARVIHCAAEEEPASNAISEVRIGGFDHQRAATLCFARCSAVKVINAPVGHGKTFGERTSKRFHIGAVLREPRGEIHADSLVLAPVEHADEFCCSNAHRSSGEQGRVAQTQEHMLGSRCQDLAVVGRKARGIERIHDRLHFGMTGWNGLAVRGDSNDSNGRAG